MKKYDNNIELFDAYLNNSMSEDDKKAFEMRLAQDAAFRQEFTAHKEMVYLLQKSCSDADKEFEEAMKNISNEAFQDIVSSNKESRAHQASAQAKLEGRIMPMKKAFQWLSIAAMVMIVVGVGANLYKSNENMKLACNVIAEGHEHMELLGTKGDEDNPRMDLFNDAISKLDGNRIDEAINDLEILFRDPSINHDTDSKIVVATELAFAYVKNRDINNALRIIEQIKKDNAGDLPNNELKKLEDQLRLLNK